MEGQGDSLRLRSIPPGLDRKLLVPTVVPPDSSLRLGNTSLDLNRRLVLVGEIAFRPTLIEFELLMTLLSRPLRVWSFRELRHEVWGDSNLRPSDTAAVRSAICRVRKKLSEARAGVRVASVRGYGFELVEDPC